MLGSNGDDKNKSAEYIRERARSILRALLVGTAGKREAIGDQLRALDFEVAFADTSANAIWMAASLPADLVVVDFRDSIAIRKQWCRSFRSSASVAAAPLIAITNEDQRDLRLELLAEGVDDCLVGPNLSEESVLRIRALLRRASMPALQTGELRCGDLLLDPAQLKVWRGGVRVHLSMLPFEVLQLLMMHPGKVFSRNELRRMVWRNRPVEDLAITKCMSRLNQSLNAAGSPEIIRRTRSGGYSLEVPGGNVALPS